MINNLKELSKSLIKQYSISVFASCFYLFFLLIASKKALSFLASLIFSKVKRIINNAKTESVTTKNPKEFNNASSIVHPLPGARAWTHSLKNAMNTPSAV